NTDERGYAYMNENLVLVTGMSGAGKSSAMNALEDLGYCCIDNFPRELLPQLQELLEKEQDRYKNIALSVSAADYTSFVNYFDNIAKDLQIIFLDCSDEELLLRYRFTRRQHPMIASGQATTLEDAIEMERMSFNQILANMNNTFHLDTTKLSSQALINRVRHRFKSTDRPEFTVTFQSFGFKHGMPMDADMVLDVRFLPNPFYEPSLRNKTGNDKEVYDYVMESQDTQEYIHRTGEMLDYVLEQYDKQNKSNMIISVGCTGGQHRSVSIANWLYDRYKDKYRCFKSHRDVEGGENG
ncbi:RNase adapter RapZ, partial [Faecalibaculum rodentium]|uniref:RNase adapter RapZ n=1 Tax=Faecalibaculum rodentium TaxID=1702221 RepID=UPI0033657408